MLAPIARKTALDTSQNLLEVRVPAIMMLQTSQHWKLMSTLKESPMWTQSRDYTTPRR